ncbi:MAG: ABC transporter permease [Lachnospiraceae bacterium]|nr:ABC transporter permease [Lachnospiraceae bacterium]
MKKHMLIKEFFMEVKKSRNRFLSILLIVLLGVAFFAGIRATSPDMELSADAYFDDASLMDIRIVSTLGLTKEDVDVLAKINGVEQVEPSYSTDVFCTVNQQQLILRLNSMTESLNQIQVTQGRMPEQADECLVDANFLEKSGGLTIGDTITVTAEDDNLGDTLKGDTFTIVGVGNSPYYLSLERGTSTIGTGQLSSFVIVPKEAFSLDVYTEASIKVAGADQYVCYSDAYDDCVKKVSDAIDEIDEERCEIRYATLQADGNQQIDEAKKKISDAKQELTDAEQELADGRQKIADGWEEITDKEQELVDAKQTIHEKEQDLADGQKAINDGYETYDQNVAALNEQVASINDGWAQLESGRQELNQGIEEYNTQKAAFDQQDAEWNSTYAPQLEQVTAALTQPGLLAEQIAQYKALQQQLQAAKEQLEAGREQLAEAAAKIQASQQTIEEKSAQLEDGAAQIEKGKAQLADALATLDEKQKEINDGAEALKDAKAELADGEQKLADAKVELADKEQELNDAQEEYDTKSADAETEISDAEVEITDAEKELADLEVPTWYVLNRNSIQTYVEYGQDAQRIAAIGNVFPVIFFLVAALICLTTMTRMVEENRMQIGTLKALGYSNGIIASKYILYALSATLAGSLLGTVLGQKLLPVVIIKAYGILYNNLPTVLSPMHHTYSILSTAMATGCTVLATVFACYKETISVPAKLMRPEAPKSGKRILLERVTFIWKHLNFSMKATFRNLFRYKKRFFMTVFGIGGCMGLLLVGFGLRDSIMAIGDRQYGKVCLYNGTITIDTDASAEDQKELTTELAENKAIDKSIKIDMSTVDVKQSTEKWSAYLMVPQNPEDIKDYVTLRDRISGDTYKMDDSHVIITEKLAKLMELSVGDTVFILDGDTSQVEVTVGAIVENYFYHYIYMTPTLYAQLYGEQPEYGQILFSMAKTDEQTEDQLRSEIMDYPAASNVSFVRSVSERIANMLKSMDSVIYVLVISAGLLAFVVLYNLNNINICERKRELATLKVLGFYEGEVSQYVLRENIWLTGIGSIFGLGFGWLMHRFIIITAEIDIMMFGRDIYLRSYLISIALTFVFSALVNLAMHFKLKKIDMVESMKSVE